MLRPIDAFLNAITMYRLTLRGLAALAVVGILFGFLGVLPYSGIALAASLVLFIASCAVTNAAFARAFRVPANIESSYITAFILFFIFAPPTSVREAGTIVLAAALAMASKYVLTARNRHVFNPAAFAAVVLGIAGGWMAVWWVGSAAMLPFVVVLGAAIVRKVRREAMVGTFFLAAAVTLTLSSFLAGRSVMDALSQAMLSWPVVFFATIMLTEPLTSPPTKRLRFWYAAAVGVLFMSRFHIGPFFSTPELALLIGNLLAFLAAPSPRIRLRLAERSEVAPGVHEFAFAPDRPFWFAPGQYLEWTLPHAKSDTRGIRRYFTIASSPTDPLLRLGVRIGDTPSTFKRALLASAPGDTMIAGGLAGDFVLPRDTSTKLVFIAGGIGITPFRSMIAHLLATEERRDITLFYACMTPHDFAYLDVFAAARKRMGLKLVRVVTNVSGPTDGYEHVGHIDAELLAKEVPDATNRTFYLSGPSGMVDAYKVLLRKTGVDDTRIITDYFPGF